MKTKKWISKTKFYRMIQGKRRKEIRENPELHERLRKKRVDDYLKTLAFNNDSPKTN